MPSRPTAQTDKPANGYRAVRDQPVRPAPDSEELEPKGTPHSDRYRAETAHAAETDDHTKARKPHHEN